MNNKKLYDFSIRLLSKRDYSSGELKKKLLHEALPEEEVDTVIQLLMEHRYLNDQRLIDSLIKKNLSKLHGLTRIKQELKKKELDPFLVEESIQKLDIDWLDICSQSKVTKFGEKLPKEQKEKAKIIRYLQYRGHAMSDIFEIISS
ncbi:RecX family transcriptional regulator [Paraphotobacterium marinum]|uniref:Regulatory protein RecX n=1 Tax=Paraphotobacterium marinum TaxID=1755811 RepID=A0A220VGJ0_9GAMM|nr:regulatory protein RecX [Paraphotobacterium marinum]ASK79356.1 RecX family transcriptional regulator [Paraphotobacterium marinum]